MSAVVGTHAARQVNLGSLDRIPIGEGRTFTVDGFEIAVFRPRSGEVFATQASCPHANGPLADGLVGNGKVVCPFHAYRFDLATGCPEGNTCAPLTTYPASLTNGGDVVVTLRGTVNTMGAPMSDSVTTSTRRAAPALEGRTIGVLEARMTDTIATLFEREGATVVRAPALAEAIVDATAEIKAWVETLLEDRYDIVVFLTGVGVTRLLDEIERLGHLDAVRAALGRTTVVARGPKPSAALGRRRIGVTVAVAEPWTTQAVVDAVRAQSLPGKRVALVHFGERSSVLAAAIQDGGAVLDELCIYEWRLPDDLGPLDKLVGLTIDGRVDAVVFTSQVQVRHFLEVAARWEREAPLIEALNAWTVTASIGPTCSAALLARGIAPRIEPTRPKLGPLVERVVPYLAVEGGAS